MAFHDGGFSQGQSIHKCSLRRIEHYKCTPSSLREKIWTPLFPRTSNGLKELEFLVFYFSYWIDGCSAEAAVSVDRDLHVIYHSDTSKQSSELIDPPSSKFRACDTAYMFGSARDKARVLRIAYGPHKKLRALPFSSATPPSALEVSILLSVIHRQASAYDVYKHESHWFADIVWRSLIELFSGDETLCRNHRARPRYHGITTEQSDQSVKAVCDAYQPEWQRMLETFEQVEQRHQAEQEKWLAKNQAGIDGGIRERQHKIDQMQAEIEQLRAKLAVSTESSAALSS